MAMHVADGSLATEERESDLSSLSASPRGPMAQDAGGYPMICADWAGPVPMLPLQLCAIELTSQKPARLNRLTKTKVMAFMTI